MTKKILHVDINSYFATLLQQENPHLRDKPMGVIKATGRTCLIATSKEAKLLGIGTGTNINLARQICPQLVAVPASLERCLDATKRLQRIFQTISPHVYIYSLDEAFIDITDCQEFLHPDMAVLAQEIQQLIKHQLGEWVTCNIGISHNRLLAKLASEVGPKGQAMEINSENLDPILAKVTFKDVCGIGYRLANKLAPLNITHPYQIRLVPQEDLIRQVGTFWTEELLKIAYGQEPHFLELIDKPPTHMKSIGRSITGFRLYHKEAEILSILANLCLEVISKTRTLKLSGRQVWLGLSGQHRFWSQHLTLSQPIRHSTELIKWVKQLYQQWPKNFELIRFAVTLSGLTPHHQDPLVPEWHRQEAVEKALDEITARFGLFTIRPASIKPEYLIKPEVTGFLGDRDYQLR
jgi:DNA polymerase-4